VLSSIFRGWSLPIELAVAGYLLMRKLFTTFSIIIGFATAGQAEDVIGFWNLNHTFDNSIVEPGSGTLSVRYFDIGASEPQAAVFQWVTGTDVNLLPPSSAGEALAFTDFFSIVADGYIEIEHIDFTGYQLPTLSFAAMQNPAVTLFSHLSIDYKIGNGSWITAADLKATPFPTAFAPISYQFLGGQLDGLSDVSMRIHFTDAVTLVAEARFDNIKITAEAVPEPSTYALLGLALVGGLLALRARRSA